jgi:hypothetical protein
MSAFLSRLVFALCASLLVAAWPQSVAAKNLALLIGVSNYELPTITKLKAPGNDVRLVWDALRERGFAKDDIVVLADDLASGTDTPTRVLRPTAQHILDELDRLGAAAEHGDLVVVYYSGHGSYMRQSTPQLGETIEATGNNQVLLAIDAQPYDPIKGELKGGIVDKTLKRKFDVLKQKAFLWLILDACHSGGFTRDMNLDVTVHFIAPEVLRLPAEAVGSREGLERPYSNPWIYQRVGDKQVAFLAAPEEYPAYEKEEGASGKHHSLFTYTLMKTLRAENFSSYRQLARAVLRAQAGSSRTVPTPVFEGDLDQQMFDGSSDGPRNWLAEADPENGEVEVEVEAGALHGVGVGTIVSFERNRTVVGYGEIIRAGASTSTARPVAFNGVGAPDPVRLVGGLTANVAKSAVSLTLKVARPPPEDNKGVGTSAIAFEAIDKLAADKLLPLGWVAARNAGADVHLRVSEGVVYLVFPTAELVREGRHRTPAVSISSTAEATAARLAENLWRVMREQNLRRIAAEMRDKGLSDAVDVRLKLIRDDAEIKSVTANEKQACKTWGQPGNSSKEKPLTPGEGPAIRLTHCDRVAVEIFNRWAKPVDITLLYVDSEGGIGPLDVDQPRIAANQAQWPHQYQPIRIVTWCDAKVWEACKGRPSREYEATGIEYLIVIVAEADAASEERRTFYYLAQPSLEKAEEKSRMLAVRGGAFDQFEDLLRSAALVPEQSRGNVSRVGDATIKLFQWEVVPPAELD